jgi:2-polyprenyl-3-methyl-5-hydroxy-6-metoxy-1,4-benzoquinol methylase
MDRSGNPAEVVEGALRSIRLTNRWLGGRGALREPFDRLFGGLGPGSRLEVLDVGTGGADLPLHLIARGAERGIRVDVTAIDRDPAAAAFAHRLARSDRRVRVVQADAKHLPFQERSFDVVTASMFLHHFDHGTVVGLLRGFRRIARRAVVINDLRRHRVPWAFIAIASHLTLRDAMFRHDAPLSVLRGFTDDELRRAARDAGVDEPDIARRWPFRLVASLPAELPQ